VLVFQVPQDYSRLSPGESHPLHALSPGIRSRSRGGPPGRSAVAVPLPAAANSRTQPPTSRTSPARPRRLRRTSHAVTASSSQVSQPPQPAMATASEGVVLPVGGVIKEPHPCCTGSLACPPLDERRRRLRRRHLLGGVVCRDPSQPVALPVSPWSGVASAGGAARRLVQAVGSKGVAEPSWRQPKLCPQPRVFARVSVPGCLQRTAAAGVAWQLTVWCGTASEDGARGIDTVGRLGLQRTVSDPAQRDCL